MGNFGRRTLLGFLGLVGTGAVPSTLHAEPKCAGERFELKKSGNQWYWTLYASNGVAVASHGGYNTRSECVAATQRLPGIARGADVSFKEDCE